MVEDTSEVAGCGVCNGTLVLTECSRDCWSVIVAGDINKGDVATVECHDGRLSPFYSPSGSSRINAASLLTSNKFGAEQ